MAILASRAIGADKSLSAPSTVIATAALARPGPIALAISPPVTPRAKVRTFPSGSAIEICASFIAADLADGQGRGNRLDRERRESVAPQEGDARPPRRGQGGIGRGAIEHRRRGAAGG